MAKITGNQLKYKSVEDMQRKIDEYFAACDGIPYYDDDGLPMVTPKGDIVYRVPPSPPTVTGLALHLGFASRQALINYQGRPAYNDAIMRAKLRIDAYAEGRLYDRDGVKGAQFTLTCNYGWGKDTADKGSTGQDDPLTAALKELIDDGPGH